MLRALRCGLGLLLVAVSTGGQATDWAPLQPGLDYHSYANIEQFRVTHVEMDLRADFDAHTLRGQVGLKIKRLDPAATQLVLDTRDLTVHDVTQREVNPLGGSGKDEPPQWVNRPWHMDKADPLLGSALVIDLPPSGKSQIMLRIDYETSPTAAALGWVGAPHAAGGHPPFMVAVAGPIAARSWLPLQDTPQARFSYRAIIHTPEELRAVMTFGNDPNAKRTGQFEFNVYEEIPAAALGLAVGDLQFKATGPRSGVYAEKALLRPAAAEFADTPALMNAAEQLLGPYPWGRFDVLVAGNAFPLAAVATPRLAFVSATLLTGDKSLVSPVVGALTAAWAGESVGCATWRDAWVVQAISRHAAARVMAGVYGEARAALDELAAYDALRTALAALPPADQALALDLRNRDPTRAIGIVPAEKGRLLLAWLAARLGPERVDDFLRRYLARFAGESPTAEQFLGLLQQELLSAAPAGVDLPAVLAWVNGAGLPAEAPLPARTPWVPVDASRTAWLSGALPAAKLDTRGWTALHWVRFLDGLPPTLAPQRLAELERTFDLERNGGAVVARPWFAAVIHAGWQAPMPRLEAYLRTVGRGALIEPLYRELMSTPAGTATARRVYAGARAGYHPQVAAALDAIVKTGAENSDDE